MAVSPWRKGSGPETLGARMLSTGSIEGVSVVPSKCIYDAMRPRIVLEVGASITPTSILTSIQIQKLVV